MKTARDMWIFLEKECKQAAKATLFAIHKELTSRNIGEEDLQDWVQSFESDVKTLKDSGNLLYAYDDELKVVMFLDSIGGRLPMQVAMVRRDSAKENKWDWETTKAFLLEEAGRQSKEVMERTESKARPARE